MVQLRSAKLVTRAARKPPLSKATNGHTIGSPQRKRKPASTPLDGKIPSKRKNISSNGAASATTTRSSKRSRTTNISNPSFFQAKSPKNGNQFKITTIITPPKKPGGRAPSAPKKKSLKRLQAPSLPKPVNQNNNGIGKKSKIVSKVRRKILHSPVSIPTKNSPKTSKNSIKKVKSTNSNPKPKAGPNSKLKPRPELTLYEKEPMFQTNLDVPFISTLSHSRLLFRPIILNDMELLRKLVTEEPHHLCSFEIDRSVANEDTLFDYILQYENKEAFTYLNDLPKEMKEKFGSSPSLLLSRERTGTPSRMMFGHAMRHVSVGRGGREGNNAFLGDSSDYYYSKSLKTREWFKGLLAKGASFDFFNFMSDQWSVETDDAYHALRMGRNDIAALIISEALESDGYGFNFLHKQVLTAKSPKDLSEFKSVSVTKKSTYNPRFTPLHCAAINPNGQILKELLRSNPEFSLQDGHGWTVGHYAATCSSPEPLEHLLTTGIAINGITSYRRDELGYNLLHAAVKAGRAHNVKLLLAHEFQLQKEKRKEIEQEKDPKELRKKLKFLRQNDIRYKPNGSGANAVQMACELGHLEIVKLLLEGDPEEAKIYANKQMNAQRDSVTPLILASQKGHLEIVKILIEAGAKVEGTDKRGKTAVIHAGMNGQAHVLSYLLRVGTNHLAVDSSGNGLLHYCVAYGWYFPTKLALEAGCPPNGLTNWKMTPMSLAFLKGHMGLVTELMKHEGVDVNARLDDIQGTTLLLEVCKAAEGWEPETLKYLVEQLKADAKAEDYDGNNALHCITLRQLDRNYNFEKALSDLHACIDFLFHQGCDPLKPNLALQTPVILAIQRSHYQFILKLLELGVTIPSEAIDSHGNTLLHRICTGIASQAHSATQNCTKDELTAIFNQMSSSSSPENLNSLKEMAAVKDSNGYTPLHLLLQSINQVDDSNLVLITSMLSTFLDKLGIHVDDKIEASDSTSGITLTSSTSLLHLTLGTFLFQTVLKRKPFIDPVDARGRTPLILAVENQDVESAKKLLKAKANPNFLCKDEKCRSPLHLALLSGNKEMATLLLKSGADPLYKVKEEHGIGLPLYLAQLGKVLDFIPKLVELGADPKEVHPLNKNSILHFITRKLHNEAALETMQEMLKLGVDPNLQNEDGRTALHLAVNMRGAETDAFYDIEEALLSFGGEKSLFLKDARGRLPLHYCFVKQGKPTEKSFVDPIELTTFIVTAMMQSRNENDKVKVKELLHTPDVFGATPLHYAAFRGSTICCSYLMQEMGLEDVDMEDCNGNTPMALAVRNGHEACSLNFFLKGADFLRRINNHIKIVDKRAEGWEVLEVAKERSELTENAQGESSRFPERKTIKARRKLESSGTTECNVPSDSSKQAAAPIIWKWDYLLDKQKEEAEAASKLEKLNQFIPILEQVVKNDWHGLLYLMIGRLQATGSGFGVGIATAFKYNRLKLAVKVCLKVRDKKELALDFSSDCGTLFHAMAKHYNSSWDGKLTLRICDLLKRTGLQPEDKADDEFDAQPVIYALINKHVGLCPKLFAGNEDYEAQLATAAPDKFGRTAFTSLFWNLPDWSEHSLTPDVKKFAEKLVHTFGADPNQLCEYPVKLNWFPGIRFTKKSTVGLKPNPHDNRWPPLTFAVICGNHSVAKWLLGLKTVDVNCPDSFGRTALMHAVWLNDLRMVRLLLQQRKKINFALKDKGVMTVMDFVLTSPEPHTCFKGSKDILEAILKVAPISELNCGDGASPLGKARRRGRFDLEPLLKKYFVSFDTDPLDPLKLPQIHPTFQPEVVLEPVEDFRKWAEKLVEDEKERRKNEGLDSNLRPVPDQNCGLELNQAELIFDPEQEAYFDILMTQVDISYGKFGLYNFYKMQLVKQLRGKGMIILFTEWGRVGHKGQFQKTPFPSESEAVLEFKKIFKQKSGNTWEEAKRFQPVKGKFRLVKKDLRQLKHANQVEVDWKKLEEGTKDLESSLPECVLELVRKLCLPHKSYKKSGNYGRSWGSDPSFENLPLLPPQELKRAELILKEVTATIKKMEGLPKDKLEEKEGLHQDLVKLSESFFELIPVYGFATQNLEPITCERDVERKLKAIDKLLYLATAKTLLLSAQCKLAEGQNPMEWIYRSLGVKIQMMERDAEEKEMILQWIHNSGRNSSVTVKGIWRVEVAGDQEKLDKTRVGNRQLLWHGTGSQNLLSILQKGLLVAPMDARISGHLFGKGIYLADIFEKSQGYCRPVMVDDRRSTKFMLLCEAALGKVHEVVREGYNYYKLPEGYDSLKTKEVRQIPDPETTLLWKGRTVAVGEKKTITKEKDPNWNYRSVEFNEYVLFNPDLVAIRYLIEFED